MSGWMSFINDLVKKDNRGAIQAPSVVSEQEEEDKKKKSLLEKGRALAGVQPVQTQQAASPLLSKGRALASGQPMQTTGTRRQQETKKPWEYKEPFGHDDLNNRYKRTVEELYNANPNSKRNVFEDAYNITNKFRSDAIASYGLKPGGLPIDTAEKSMRATVDYMKGLYAAEGKSAQAQAQMLAAGGRISPKEHRQRQEQGIIGAATQLYQANNPGIKENDENWKRLNAQAGAYERLADTLRNVRDNGGMAYGITDPNDAALYQQMMASPKGKAVISRYLNGQATDADIKKYGQTMADALRNSWQPAQMTYEQADKYLGEQMPMYNLAKDTQGQMDDYTRAYGDIQGIGQRAARGETLTDTEKQAWSEATMEMPWLSDWRMGLDEQGNSRDEQLAITPEQQRQLQTFGETRARQIADVSGLYSPYAMSDYNRGVWEQYVKTPEGAAQWAEEAQGTKDEQKAKDNLWFVERQSKYDEVAKRPDFAETSKAKEDFHSGNDGFDNKYNVINNIGGAGDRAGMLADIGGSSSYAVSLYHFMTPEEKRKFNYYANAGAIDEANEYLDYLSYAINERMTKEGAARMQAMSESGAVGAVIGSAVSVPLSIARGVGYLDQLGQNVAQAFTGRPVDRNSQANMLGKLADSAREGVQNQVDWNVNILGQDVDVFDFLYGTAMSGIDSFTAGQLGAALGGIASSAEKAQKIASWTGAAILGGGAAQSAMQEAYDRGANDGTALLMGAIAGANETLWERWSIGNLIEHGQEVGKKTFAEEIKNVLTEAGVNASEEFNTSVANGIAEYFLNHDDREVQKKADEYERLGLTKEEAMAKARGEFWASAVMDAAGGALMGAGFGMVENAQSTHATKQVDKAVGSGFSTQALDTLYSLAGGENAPEKAKNLAKKYQKEKASARQVGEIFRAVVEEANESVRDSLHNVAAADIALQIGRQTGAVDTRAADAVADMMAGKTLSGVQVAAIAQNKAALSIVNELFKPDAEAKGDAASPHQSPAATASPQGEALNSALEPVQFEPMPGMELPGKIDTSARGAAAGAAAEAPKINVQTVIGQDKSAAAQRIESIDEDEGGGVRVKLEDGQTVDLEDAGLSAPMQEVARIAAGQDQAKAAALMNAAAEVLGKGNGGDSSRSVPAQNDSEASGETDEATKRLAADVAAGRDFALGFSAVYDAAAKGQTREQVRTVYGEQLAEDVREKAYEAGRQAFERLEEQARQRNMEEAKAFGFRTVAEAVSPHQLPAATASPQGEALTGVLFDRVGDSLRDKDGNVDNGKLLALKLIDRVFKQTGMQARVVDKLENDANGKYVHGTNIVYLSMDAEEGAITRAASHEGFHFISAFSPDMKKTITDFVLDRLGRVEGYDLEQRIKEVRQRYRDAAGQELEQGEDRYHDGAIEEIVADSMLDVIGTEENMRALMKESTSTAEKIREWITNTYNKFKEILNRLAGYSPETAALKDDVDYLGKISEMWNEGARQAAEAWQQAQAGYNDSSAALEQNQAVQQYRQEMQGDMTVEDRENSLTAFLSQLFMDTQGPWIQANMDAYEEGLAKYRQALLDYKRGGVALNVALERQGLNRIAGNDIRVASYAAEQALTLEGAKERAKARALADDLEESDGAESYGDHKKFSLRVTDKDELDFLDNQETVKTYKTMQLVDGKLYPPMAAVVAGSMEDHSVLGQWEKATEHPELIKNGNKFTLNKGRGKGSIDAAYNPYMHSSNLMINDQFSGAYNRPDLVTVECEVPVSELNSGYHAEYAKDSVGWHSWHTGTVAGQLRNQKGVERQVMLSRWIKPVRIISNSEVAQHYAELLAGTDIAVPDNVVPPALLEELKKAGVPIKESGRLPQGKYSLPSSKKENGLDSNEQNNYSTEERGDRNGEQKERKQGFSEDDGRGSVAGIRERVGRALGKRSKWALTGRAAVHIDRGDYSDVISKEKKGYELFQRALSGSKLVSKKGEPRIWYHGSSKSFVKFDGQQYGRNYDGTIGNYFTSSGRVAGFYAGKDISKRNIYPVGVYSGHNIVFKASEFNDNYEVQNYALNAINTARKYTLKLGKEKFLNALNRNLERDVSNGKYSKSVADKIFEAFDQQGDIDSVEVKGAIWDTDEINDQLIVFDADNIIPATAEFWNEMAADEAGQKERYSLPSKQRQEADAAEAVRQDAELYAQMRQDADSRAALELIMRMHQQTTQGGENALIKPGAFEKRLSEMVAKIKEDTATKMGDRTIRKGLRTIYQAMEKPGYSVGEILTYAREFYQQVLEQAPGALVEMDDSTREAVRILRTNPFQLTPDQKSEIKGTYGSLGDFMRKNFGKLKIRNEAKVTLADVWSESLNPLNPGLFAEDTAEADMPGIIDAFLENAHEKKFSGEFGANIGAMSTDGALNLMLDFYDVPGAYKQKSEVRAEYQERFDQARALVNQYRVEARQAMNTARAEYQQKYRERLEKDRQTKAEREAKQGVINEIKRNVKPLKTMLVKGTDNRHIPEALRGAIERMLNNLGMDRAIFSGQEARELYMKLGKWAADSQLHDAAEAAAYDPDILAKLEWLEEHAGKAKALRDMTMQELEAVRDAVQNMYKMVTEENEIEVNGRKRKVADLAGAVMSQMKDKKEASSNPVLAFLRKVGYKEMTPVYYAKQVGGTLGDLINDMIRSESDVAFIIKDAKGAFDKAAEKYHLNDWIHDKNHLRFQTSAGDTIELTREQAMTLYAWAEREKRNKTQSAAHLRRGGFTYDRNDKDVKQMKGVNFTKSHVLSDADVARIKNYLTDEQRGFVETMVKYLSEDMAEKGNEASMRMFGWKKYGEKWYFPYPTDENFRGKNSTKAKGQPDKQIKYMGSSHALTENAMNPLELANFTEIWAGHVDEMARYSVMAEKLDNLQRVTNYVVGGLETETGEVFAPESVKKEIERALGQEGAHYLEQLIRDANGGVMGDERGLSDKFISLFKKGSVAANMSVILQQPSAFVRAMSMVNPRYFGKGLHEHGGFKATRERMYANSGVANLKQWGGFDTNTGGTFANTLLDSMEKDGKLEKARAFIDEWTGKGAEKADEITWVYMYSAIEAEIDDRTDYKRGTEDFNKAVARRFDEVMRATQVYDSSMAKSEWMRSTSTMDKIVTSFMAEPTLWINMMMDAALDLKNNAPGARGKAARALGVFVAGTFVNSLLQSIATALRRKKDEGTTIVEKYLSEFASNFTDSLSIEGIASMIPIARDIVSLFQGYDVERADMAVIGNMIDAWRKMEQHMKKGEMPDVDEWMNLAGMAGNLFGVPVRNVYRDVSGIIMNTFGGASSPIGETSGRDILYSVLDDTSWNSFFKLWDPSNAAYYDRMEQALIKGDMDKYKELRGYLEDTKRVKSDTITTGLKNELKESVLRGLVTEEKAVDIMVSLLGVKDEKTAYDQIDKYVAKAKANGDEDFEYSKYAGLMDAVQSGGDVEAEIKRLEERGNARKTVVSNIKSQVKEWYLAGDMTKAQAENALKTYVGISDTDNYNLYWTLEEWDWLKANPNGTYKSYGNIFDAVDSGNAQAIKAAVQKHLDHPHTKQMATDVHRQITDHFKPIYVELWNSGRKTEAANLKAAILTAYEAAGYARDMKNKDIEKWLK